MAKRFISLFIAVIIICPDSFAGKYEGLQPGVSDKAKADAVLGAPLRVVVPGLCFDYPPERHHLKQLSVSLNSLTQKIETIDLYTLKPYPKFQYQQWFDLGTPVHTFVDVSGHKVEYYSPEGLALHYDGNEVDAEILYFSHIDPALISTGQKKTVPTATRGQAQPSAFTSATHPYLGIRATARSGRIQIDSIQENSPAAKAGLQAGDIILEADGQPFDGRYANPKFFSDRVALMPLSAPVSFLIERGAQRLTLPVVLEGKTVELTAEQLARQNYLKADRFIKQGYCETAVSFLEKAIEHDPRNAFYLMKIGYCLARMGKPDDAIPFLETALQIKPAYYPNYLLGAIYWEKWNYDAAVRYLEPAVALRPVSSLDTTAHELLGASYYEKGMIDAATDVFIRAYHINDKRAFTVFYLGACFDRQGKVRDAARYYERYLDMKSNDLKMNEFAHSRLQILQGQTAAQSSQTADSLLKLIDVISKDIARVQESQ